MHSGQIFLSEKLASVDDIDAALSAVADDYHGSATEYLARIDCTFFRAISTPELMSNLGNWQDIVLRLKGTSLVLWPALPSFDHLQANPDTLDVIDLPPLRLSAGSDGKPIWQSLDHDTASAVRKIDLEHIVKLHEKRCMLTVSTGHFELPSGAHTSHFFRAAECLADLGLC